MLPQDKNGETQLSQAPAIPINEEVTTDQNVDPAAVARIVQEHLERERGYLKFAQEQAEKDRAYFKHLFDRSAYFLGALVVFAGIFGYRSVDQLRDDARSAVQSAQAKVDRAVEGMQSDAQRELDRVRVAVTKRVDDEFRTERIAQLVRAVAKERTEGELQGVIRSETITQVAKGIREQAPTIQKAVEDETKRAVRDLQPSISNAVGFEVSAQVQKQVLPVQSQLKSYGDVIRVGTLATLAKSDDRKAFDELVAIADGSKDASADERKVATSTAVAIVREKNSGISLGYNFKQKQTPEAMKQILLTSRFANDRMAAVQNYPADDKSILSLLARMVASDESIDVVCAAFGAFNSRTSQSFQFPNYGGLMTWWNDNKRKFE